MSPPWRNGLACWTSNSKVVGSSPTGGVSFLFFFSCLDVSVYKDLAKAKIEKPTINVKPANVKKFILV